MKILNFLIFLILCLQILSVPENFKESKKNKGKYIIEHFFKNKIKKKSKNNLIKGDRDELSYNFDFWERMGYKNIESNTNKKKEKEIFINLSKDQSTIYDNYNNEYINDITKEINVIKGDCKANDLLTKFNNRRFIEDEPLPNLESSNLPNNNRDNNDQYNELLQRNKMNHNMTILILI